MLINLQHFSLLDNNLKMLLVFTTQINILYFIFKFLHHFNIPFVMKIIPNTIIFLPIIVYSNRTHPMDYYAQC